MPFGLPLNLYFCIMEVNDELIEKLAHLAKLRFNDDEKEGIRKDLQNMLGLIEKMEEINTDNVEPLLHMSGNVNVVRADEVKGSISNEEALRNAAQKQEPFFIVPKVIKK
jgi:aspartyl-tRNA(Asn)/glutamyl-tRNA(Gln) amidotransferase subunit C